MDIEKVTFSAPGKVILFGEHSVVYGYPAIASAIGLRAKCSINSTSLEKNSISIPNIIPARKFILGNEIPGVLKSLEFIVHHILKKTKNQKKLEMEILSDLPVSAGLGSSAAVSVSVAASLFSILGIEHNLENVNEVAFDAEKIIHGTPSGIDNTISTFGGSIIFEESNIKQIPINLPLSHFIIVNSLVPRNTKDLVYSLRDRYNKDTKKYSQLFEKIGEIVEESQKNLKLGDLERIGDLMNRNHILLDELGVGNKHIKKIVSILNNQKAFGCKLTGAGGGGCVIGLFEDRENINNVIELLHQEGYNAFITDISTQGVRHE
ncbi:MAG: mevalonate kinase [Asgard group archaeon]|nr:mevalonate kinase [Asgard group archaeon]